MTTKATPIGLLLALLLTASTFAQQSPATDNTQKMSVNERMTKARAAKAEKSSGDNSKAVRVTKAIPADYNAPVDKTQKGPNGEVVHTGEHGGKYYINKNGNKTYLSSNQ